MKLTTLSMDPLYIEPHDVRRDVETYRDEFPTDYARQEKGARVIALKLQRVVLEAVASRNPYAVALAACILNLDAPNTGEPS